MAVNDQYELYCLADRLFYDTADRRGIEIPDFAVAGREVPRGWSHQPSDTWFHYAPTGHDVPPQGWKIHVSAGLADAARVLEIVWDYCVERDIPFKFLRSRSVVTMLNSKGAARGASGKLVTIYPRQDCLELTLKELDGLLAGVRGPYILSDLRYGDGPLFVRYGGFVARRCVAANGDLVPAMENDRGELVPDVRGPSFTVPDWVELPGFLTPHLEARNAVTTTELPYAVESVMHFSNGGGVYLATDRRSGERVVLKEARPMAGLDAAERDAVARLQHEREVLRRLDGLDCVPGYRDYFVLGDHHFLVMEFVDATPLQRTLVRTFPLTKADATAESIAEYTVWALDTLPKVRAAIEALHERGVVFCDLHPNNILVTPEGRLVLIDFEVATFVEDRGRSVLAHPAFQAPADRRGADVDHYALACLTLGLFAPQLTITVPLARAKASQLGRLIVDTFPVPPELVKRAVHTISGPIGGGPTASVTLGDPMAAMARAILASATPERADRLFPGDPAQFRPGGGVNLAHGAAGVLFALDAAGAGRFPDLEEWLLRQRPESPPGFYDGLHGVAYVLDRFGHVDRALDLVDRAMAGRWRELDLGLWSGLAGIGLNLLHLGLDARPLVELCAERLPDDVPETSGGANPRAGLLYGLSGPALLFLRAYDHTRDPALLDLAERALRLDLKRCVLTSDGSLQVNQGWRTLPYLDEGSVGIAIVLADLLRQRPGSSLAAALPDLLKVGRCRFFVQPGLFAGRAGMVMADRTLIPGLDWHVLPYRDGIAFPGDQLLRLSMDFATGTAGVLYALSGTPLPFTHPLGAEPYAVPGGVPLRPPAKEVIGAPNS
ncbi:lantipeptide synthetase [Herbidospora galbida]|uniref:non-specific serine/threonine protein kinase n=1 Tax=Herbidospora galbida TaxID=2575442 RepID=A0A4U3MBV7_9ACTN|nr:class III lanthionine synthetase LanKC [Herbidospora galbida]TKK86728.1 lantipeptide synthetase [Herbidospora galbida]